MLHFLVNNKYKKLLKLHCCIIIAVAQWEEARYAMYLGHIMRIGQLGGDVELKVGGVGYVAVSEVQHHLTAFLERLL